MPRQNEKNRLTLVRPGRRNERSLPCRLGWAARAHLEVVGATYPSAHPKKHKGGNPLDAHLRCGGPHRKYKNGRKHYNA